MSVLITPNEVGLREDLSTLDLMGDNLTIAYNKARKGVATNPHHEWLEDSMGAGNADNAAIQGKPFEFATVDTKLRMGNYTQIVENMAGISRTSIQSKLATGGKNAVTSELTYQKEKAMRQNAIDIDAAMLVGIAQAPTGSTPGKMGGFIQLTNSDNQYTSEGATLTWDDIDKGLNLMITAGAQPDTAIVTPVMKSTVVKLNETSPYKTVIVNSDSGNGKSRKGVNGYGSFFAGSNAEIEVYSDPRQAASTITMFESDKVSLDVLGTANVENQVQFDGIGLAIITECCLKLSHSKACSVLTMTT